MRWCLEHSDTLALGGWRCVGFDAGADGLAFRVLRDVPVGVGRLRVLGRAGW